MPFALLMFIYMMGMVEELEMGQLEVKLAEYSCGLLCTRTTLYWWQTRGWIC